MIGLCGTKKVNLNSYKNSYSNKVNQLVNTTRTWDL